MKNEEYEITTNGYTFNITATKNKDGKITLLEVTCPPDLHTFKSTQLWELKEQLEAMTKIPFSEMRTSKINLNNSLEELEMNSLCYTNIKSLTLPSSMTTLHDYSIADCHQLKEIILNDGLEIIGQYALRCDPIETITLPSTIKYLAPDIFYGCSKLKNVNMPKNVFEKYDHVIDLKDFLGCPHSEITITKPKSKILHN